MHSEKWKKKEKAESFQIRLTAYRPASIQHEQDIPYWDKCYSECQHDQDLQLFAPKDA